MSDELRYFVYFDFETGGLNPYPPTYAEPIELAAILLKEQPDGPPKRLTSFGPILMKVQHPKNLNARALGVNGKTAEEVMAGVDPEQAFLDFAFWLAVHTGGKKVYPVAHNAKFDILFMRWAWDKYVQTPGFETVWNHNDVCTANQVFFRKVLIEKTLKFARLQRVSEYYGIEHEAHTAMGDVLVGTKLFELLWEETLRPDLKLVLRNHANKIGITQLRALVDDILAGLERGSDSG